MPDRIPTFRPPWIAKRPRERDERPSAAARGYGGRGWMLARRQALVRDNYQCRSCGHVVHGKAAHVDHITPKAQGGSDLLGNLQTLCASCHSEKTCREQRGGVEHHVWSLHPEWMPRSCVHVTLVCGPPASGKNLYVERHKGERDLVVDLDVIASEMAGSAMHNWGLRWLGPAVRKRNEILASLHRENARKYSKVWFIAGEPLAEHRQWWVDRLGVRRVVVIETPARVCESRIMTQPDRLLQHGAAYKWWASYTRREGDERLKTLGNRLKTTHDELA